MPLKFDKKKQRSRVECEARHQNNNGCNPNRHRGFTLAALDTGQPTFMSKINLQIIPAVIFYIVACWNTAVNKG